MCYRQRGEDCRRPAAECERHAVAQSLYRPEHANLKLRHSQTPKTRPVNGRRTEFQSLAPGLVTDAMNEPTMLAADPDEMADSALSAWSRSARQAVFARCRARFLRSGSPARSHAVTEGSARWSGTAEMRPLSLAGSAASSLVRSPRSASMSSACKNARPQ